MNNEDILKKKYIIKKEGNIPLILLSPHSGNIDLKKIPRRENYINCKWKDGNNAKCHSYNNLLSKIFFITENDGPLNDLVEKITKSIFKLTGKTPYIVMSNIIRGEIDMNRESYLGTENEVALSIWKCYFNTIDKYTKSIISKFEKGLIIDFHGYKKRKSNNKKIIQLGYGFNKIILKNILERSDKLKYKNKNLFNKLNSDTIYDNIYGNNSLGSIFDSLNLNAYPSKKYKDITKIKNFKYYNGGYTTKRYMYNLNTIQLEFPQDYLRKYNSINLSINVSLSILVYLNYNNLFNFMYIKGNNNYCSEIYNKFKNSKKYNLYKYLLPNLNNKTIFCKLFFKSLKDLNNYRIINKKSKINISKKKYFNLINKLKNKKISKKEFKLLKDNLYIKFCKCIKKLLIKNKLLEQNNNPYAICTSSIYKNRNIDVPIKASRNCSKKIKWYKLGGSYNLPIMKNLRNNSLKNCSTYPLTGYYRDGFCRTGKDDSGTHSICAKID